MSGQNPDMNRRTAYITRSSVCLPNAPVENDQVEAILGQVGERPSRARRVVQRSNGIRRRYYVIDPVTGKPNYTNASLTAAAIRGLAGNGFALDDLACLACGTSNPDQLMPNHAVMVHGELGVPVCEVVATAGVCVSGATALKYGWMSVMSGDARKPSEAISDPTRRRWRRVPSSPSKKISCAGCCPTAPAHSFSSPRRGPGSTCAWNG